MSAQDQIFASIVVGTDGSETADKAVQSAIAMAEPLGAKLHIVTAFQLQPASQADLDREAARVPAEMSWILNRPEAADRILRIAGDRARERGLEVETYARQGDPADALLDVAEERDADLIVVGNKGMTGAKRFLLGSVPNKVSHHAPCSVLIIRTT